MNRFNIDKNLLRKLDKLVTCEHETVDELLDQALTIARMVNPETDNANAIGPLERLVTVMEYLERRVETLEREISWNKKPNNSYIDPNYSISNVTIPYSGMYTGVIDPFTYVSNISTTSGSLDESFFDSTTMNIDTSDISTIQIDISNENTMINNKNNK